MLLCALRSKVRSMSYSEFSIYLSQLVYYQLFDGEYHFSSDHVFIFGTMAFFGHSRVPHAARHWLQLPLLQSMMGSHLSTLLSRPISIRLHSHQISPFRTTCHGRCAPVGQEFQKLLYINVWEALLEEKICSISVSVRLLMTSRQVLLFTCVDCAWRAVS